jgi:LL-diaminopimelate aminotransferase
MPVARLVVALALSADALNVARNPHFAKLQGGYLFPEIGRRRSAFVAEHPELADRIISLGIGDTTQPIPEHILGGLVNGAAKLGTTEGYTGYGAEAGVRDLREKIAAACYGSTPITADEVFVSDGAKCDIARLQLMFGNGVVSAVQDPSYPVYVDTSVMLGQTGTIDDATGQFDGIVYMPCAKEDGFFPNLDAVPRADVYYFCSPNNPTGAVATRAQLEALVARAKSDGSILVFDAAYAPFIRTPGVPTSIFEIDGATECAIEVNSFSKYAGFTGARLGWTVVPDALTFKDGSKVRDDFNRVMTTCFNGASNVVQQGGLACLDPEGRKEIDTLIDYYLGNAEILRGLADDLGLDYCGGVDSPYVFVDLKGKSSWKTFNTILEQAQVVTIPGAGFGPGGEGYLRFSAFAPRDACVEARKRIKEIDIFAGQ